MNTIHRNSRDRYLYRLLSRRLRHTHLDEEKGLIKASLMTSTVSNSEGIDFCVICQDDIFLDLVRKLSCKHIYHLKCIDNWFLNNSNCPTCKREF